MTKIVLVVAVNAGAFGLAVGVGSQQCHASPSHRGYSVRCVHM
jgi:hypothetical protein